jgi:hypothetical protein
MSSRIAAVMFKVWDSQKIGIATKVWFYGKAWEIQK